MDEWLTAVLTIEWLLGASMALAGRRLLTWVRAVTSEFSQRDEQATQPSQPNQPETETES